MAQKADAPESRDVYISYSRPDVTFARLLSTTLPQFGFSAWVELGDLPPGTDWQVELDRRLDSSNTLLFVISRASIRSEACLRELERAVSISLPIIPLVREHVPQELLPVDLARRTWVDFSNEHEFASSLKKLIAAIQSPSSQTRESPPVVEATNVDPPAIKQEPQIKITLQSPSGTNTEDFAATHALAHLLARATRINQSYEKALDLTFSSILLGFLVSDDPLSQWFVKYVRNADIRLDELLKARKLERATLVEIADEPLSEVELSTLNRPRRRSESAKKLFEEATRLNSIRPEPSLLDVRHLMAAFIYNPAGHETDLDGLRFRRVSWSNAFLGKMKDLYPQELADWSNQHRITFSEEAAPAEEIEGPSTHIASDMWTINDTLGYRAYAYAISRFMTHPQTKPPLTISIQAPWGGGKSSLMRMIQHALDPDARKVLESEAKQPRGVLTIQRALEEIGKWIQPEPNIAKVQSNVSPTANKMELEIKEEALVKKVEKKEALPTISPDENRKALTIWFNAWKYESVNQVWSGLVDAIMQQVAARLSLLDREIFWLRLNLKRVDADKLRHKIHERIFNYWWRGMRYWLIGVGGVVVISLFILLTGWLSSNGSMSRFGWVGTSLAAVGSIVVAALKYLHANLTVKNEPAVVSLNDYLDIPDYSTELGFVHRVEADLRRVLACIPEQKAKPIVIFIDDLDRCAPSKVAQVVEAVNLFLAGDFPNCMFVLGMDTEMVAAALQSAHKDMISCLPADAGIPVGWRFMDKFVQLPFIIPPTEKENLTRYTSSLFSTNLSQMPDLQVDRLAQEAAVSITTRVAVANETERLRVEHKLSAPQVARMKDQLEARVVERKLDEGIEKFTDENPEIKRVVADATSYFRGNPRELKRFVNSFRFQYFLWWAQRAQGLEVPSLDQLRRWTVLSMKWPEVIRWLRRSGGNEWRVPTELDAKVDGESVLPTRLKLLEDISEGSTDLTTWHAGALKVLRLEPTTTSWLNDDDLLQFFYEDCKKYPSGRRLSDGLGKGLW